MGGVHSIWDYYLYSYVEQFQAQFKKVAFRLVTDHTGNITQSILDGTTDLGVVYSPPQHPDIEIITWKEETFKLIASKELNLSKHQVNLKGLNKYSFIYQEWGGEFHDWFHKEAGKNFLPSLEVGHAHLLLELVSNNKAMCFILDSIQYKAVSPPPIQKLYIIYSKKNSKKLLIQGLVNKLMHN
ncbi:LysR family transcriptional regulator substrate-binding protein [Chengkuizengella axinellae]|uniref:LysR family transcriptional regulator substrate-binding protein n=1 Tax=Chengkuizengella axinellae TaxID=3064388 RepID=A0ABT9J2Z1_9BACL|nr:LysR family transcriptional regulator substrate-binding protein [Chengkuizengella sp. 2205SS18-9]MDP5275385.1 LysR family transcriptional regulator substrate-binding protein [Chengkuizengella sp. 2205SS18-9]